MSLRINHGIAAENAHRSILKHDSGTGRTLDQLSGGLRNQRNSAPSVSFIISDHMRSHVAGLSQAVHNSESAVSMVQTAESSLHQVLQHLNGMRKLTIHAVQEGISNPKMLEANQAEMIKALDSLDHITATTRFGSNLLLDGSYGVAGTTTGEGLRFISAGLNPALPIQQELTVRVSETASQSSVTGTQALTRHLMRAGETITIRENGHSVQLTTDPEESLSRFVERLNNQFIENNIPLAAKADSLGHLTIRHLLYGSNHGFGVTSTTSGVLSEIGQIQTWVQNGQDVQGTIHNEKANGLGQYLIGAPGSAVEGLTLAFSGVLGDALNRLARRADRRRLGTEQENEEGMTDFEVGVVFLTANALSIQLGGDIKSARVLLPEINSAVLGTRVPNASGFQSIRDIDLRVELGGEDALDLIQRAIEEISTIQTKLGAVQRNSLETNLASLSIAKENIINAESVINGADMAITISEYTRKQIAEQSAVAMLAQANQTATNVLNLLK